jgi:hypothetical protein
VIRSSAETLQTESADGGRTWTTPHFIAPEALDRVKRSGPFHLISFQCAMIANDQVLIANNQDLIANNQDL